MVHINSKIYGKSPKREAIKVYVFLTDDAHELALDYNPLAKGLKK
jgi:hypothetical protein